MLEGVYHCLATNTRGTVRSLPATLTRTGMSSAVHVKVNVAVAGYGLVATWLHHVQLTFVGIHFPSPVWASS